MVVILEVSMMRDSKEYKSVALLQSIPNVYVVGQVSFKKESASNPLAFSTDGISDKSLSELDAILCTSIVHALKIALTPS
jgi:hypothetical protein